MRENRHKKIEETINEKKYMRAKDGKEKGGRSERERERQREREE